MQVKTIWNLGNKYKVDKRKNFLQFEKELFPKYRVF